MIDRLLASPRYGERWGRHWLDVVRFGESNGYEHDELRDQRLALPRLRHPQPSMTTSRIAQFVKEQLAGDVLRAGDGRGRHRDRLPRLRARMTTSATTDAPVALSGASPRG